MGFMGSRVARRLIDSGHQVRGLTKTAPTNPSGPGNTEVGDAADRQVVRNALEGCATVIWCAGRLLPVSSDDALAHIDDVTPMVTVLEELAARGGNRFIYL